VTYDKRNILKNVQKVNADWGNEEGRSVTPQPKVNALSAGVLNDEQTEKW